MQVICLILLFCFCKIILLEVPSAPGRPVVSEATPDEATLTWPEGPAEGGPAEGYNVYVREKGQKQWKKVTKTVTKKKSHTVTDLAVDKEYEAQVTAVNTAGESEPSDTSKPFKLQPGGDKRTTSKAAPGKNCFLSNSKMKKISKKSGKKLRSP